MSFQTGVSAFDSGNYAAAYKAWISLAEQGHVIAQTNIAVMFAQGLGVPKDMAAAAKWFQLAAKAGNPKALFKLATMYATGDGVEHDLVQANVLAQRAANRYSPGINREKALELVKQLQHSLSETQRSAAHAEAASDTVAMSDHAPPRRLDPRNPAAFRETVIDYRKRTKLQGDTLIAGNVQMLGLEDVQKHAGANWPSVKERVYKIIEEAIEHHLGDADLYVRAAEDQFIILFGSSLKVEAEQTARAIALEIEKRLTEEIPGGAEISVRGVAVPIDAGKDGGAIATFEALAATLRKATAKAEETSHQIIERLKTDAKIGFWPLAQLKKRLISIYDAGLTASSAADAEAAAKAQGQNDPGALAADLDCLVLDLASKALAAAGGLRRKAVILIPVHYETLASKQFRAKLLESCRRLPHSSSRRALFHVLDLPEGVPQSRLNQVFGMVKPFALGFVVRTSLGFKGTDSLIGIRLLGISVDGSGVKTLSKPVFDELRALVARASKHKFRVIFSGAQTIEAAQVARRAGASYANGPAVFPLIGEFGRVVRVN